MGLRQSKSKTKTTQSTKYEASSPVEQSSSNLKQYRPAHSDAVLSVACFSNEEFLSAGADTTIVSYRWREGRIQHKWTGHSKDVTKVAYSAGMDRVFSSSRDKTAKMWTREGAAGSTTNDPVQSYVGHNLVVTGIAPVDASRRLCTGGRDNSVRLWDTETGACVREVTTSRNLVTHMVTIPRTETVIQTSEDKSIRIWDTRTMEESGASNKKSYIQTCCDVRSDGVYCLSSSNGFNGQGCEASLWDVRNMKNPTREFKGHMQTASGCCFIPSPESRPLFVTCSHDQTVRLWDQNSGSCLCTFTLPGSKQVTSVAVQTEGSICVGTFETGIYILNVQEASDASWDFKAVCQY